MIPVLTAVTISVSDSAPAVVVGFGVNEMIPFRTFRMPCCGKDLCWVQPKYPTHCPSCGEHVYLRLRSGDYTLCLDDGAWIRYKSRK
jgi:hypothetical protein